MKKFGLLLFLCLGMAALGVAQNKTQSKDPFAELQRQMEKMMQDLRAGYSIQFPTEADTTLFFKWDTTLNNGNGDLFLRFGSPSGKGSDDPFGFNEMIKEFKDFAQGLNGEHVTPGGDQPPADDGANPDEVLPEERLRDAEKGVTPKQGETAPKLEKAEPKKPKIKTTRI